MRLNLVLVSMALSVASAAAAKQPAARPVGLLVEAESFARHGGWKLDTQFIHTMGSPYLLAHGLGRPVADAQTHVEFPETGDYHVFVRTKDWVAPWDVKGSPGRFQLLIDGRPDPSRIRGRGRPMALAARRRRQDHVAASGLGIA